MIPFALVLLPASMLLAQQYTVRPLAPVAQTPGAIRFEPGTRASALASSGAAGGCTVTDTATRNVHACRWLADGTAVDLGVTGTDVHSVALGGNAAGDLVGTSFSLGSRTLHGVLWRVDGVVTSLGNMEAVDVNASRVVAGNANATGNVPAATRAVRWTNGATATLPPLAGGVTARAAAISDAGWIVGNGLLPDRSTTHACLWTGTAAPLDLGTLPGGTNSFARGIAGTTVVGVSDTASGVPHAVRWNLSAAGALVSMDDLGVVSGQPGSAAEAVDATGRIGGNSGDAAVLFTPAGIVDLNTRIPAGSGWVLTHVTGFGEGGRIVGRGRANGLPRGFVLEPLQLVGDLDGNGAVDGADLGILLGHWGTTDPASDLNHDGTVDGADLGVLLGHWTT
ncbi:MAG: hypothetical protein U0625_09045 [Phycisphaerales bacterium]